jgi:hypothetical protein
MREYDLIAAWYASDRGRIVGVTEALAVAATLPPRSCILDVGCGNGVLKPGAPFLFTAAEIVGAADGGITGTMNGVTFHYYAVESYRQLPIEHGLMLVDVHDDPGVSTYYLAVRARS